MNKNVLLWNACMALLNAARIVKPIDPVYTRQLLDKAEQFKNEIVVDEKLEKEVRGFEQRIKKGLSD